ncbi:ArsR/SmtB family transcription factor (plasmid) [Streptomyces sp. BI20]|uniref:ArsR/SmtB family transcription factor n=1 Tax=Streptomyces sp. BI20 TaxID=3403460 RepID=UPI003C71A023
MGLWALDAETLAHGRFALSPLTETVAALRVLVAGAPSHPAERDWVAAHLPAFRARLDRDPGTAALVRAGLRRTWTADFLTPVPPVEGTADFAGELAVVRATPPERARADLRAARRHDRPRRPADAEEQAGWAGPADGPDPDAGPDAGPEDLPGIAADLLSWLWERAVAPDWDRRRQLLAAHVVARTRQVAEGGWAAALECLGPDVRWLGDGRLRINARDNPDREIIGARLLLVPVTPRHGWVTWREPDRYALVHPCTGVLAEPGRRPAPRALTALLGPARARVLLLTVTPMSTTHLVAATGLALGSVGRHLRVLTDAGLLERHRQGRSVLYRHTPAARVLLRAAGG